MWLAGHDYCGYSWLAKVPTGTIIVVKGGPAKGTYRVYGHLTLKRRGGPIPKTGASLVLQTCVKSGTGLTLAKRV